MGHDTTASASGLERTRQAGTREGQWGPGECPEGRETHKQADNTRSVQLRPPRLRDFYQLHQSALSRDGRGVRNVSLPDRPQQSGNLSGSTGFRGHRDVDADSGRLPRPVLDRVRVRVAIGHPEGLRHQSGPTLLRSCQRRQRTEERRHRGHDIAY